MAPTCRRLASHHSAYASRASTTSSGGLRSAAHTYACRRCEQGQGSGVGTGKAGSRDVWPGEGRWGDCGCRRRGQGLGRRKWGWGWAKRSGAGVWEECDGSGLRSIAQTYACRRKSRDRARKQRLQAEEMLAYMCPRAHAWPGGRLLLPSPAPQGVTPDKMEVVQVVQDMPLVDNDADIECEHFETRQVSSRVWY